MIVPLGNREYPVAPMWRGQRHAMSVVFSERFCREVRQNGAKVDIEAGQLILSDGSRQDLLGTRAAFEAATKLTAPPWLFRLPNTPRAFVLAKGRLFVDV